MRAESATAVLGSFMVIVVIIGTSSYPTHPPAETLLAPERERTLDTTSPVILWTSPAHGHAVYPDVDIVVQFNESMNTSSFSYEFLSGWDPGMNWSWENSVHENDTVRGTHDILFGSPAYYEFNVTYAEDVAGNPLAPGPVPNPWNWSTIVVIIETVPADGETNVRLSQDIVVFFSGPVDVLTLPLPFWTIVPDPGGGWAITWTNGDTSVVLSHAVPFEPCTLYTVYLHIGLSPFPSLVPNPWSFTTVCPTRIIRTDPYDGQTDVPLYHSIEVEFSKPMDPATVTWTIGPNPGGWSETWSANDTILTMSHLPPFLACQVHNVSITGGQDMDGYWLLPGFDLVPNPWSFTTTCEYPYILSTDPFDGETGVGLWKEIVIEFDETINLSMPFDFEVTPELPGTVWTTIWNNNTTVTLNHSLLLVPASQIVVHVIEAYDLDGNPLVQGPVRNPFSFYTNGGLGPWIEQTDPPHAALAVPLNESIVVIFSESMDVPSVTWDIEDLGGPSPITFTPSWNQTVYPDDTLTLSHVTPFVEWATYFVLIDGQDLDSNPLESGPVPNPWSFTIEGIMPMIVSTDPANGEVNVALNKSIVIDFNEEMQPASFMWSIVPDPGGWTAAWSNDNSTVTLNHSIDFGQCTIHTVHVTQAWDLDGTNIIPGPWPNPWVFATECISPYVVSTDPHDGETGVPLDHDITVVFSEPMETGTVIFDIQPSLPLSTSWSANDTVMTVSHASPFLECQVYLAVIGGGEDKDGNPLIPGPWPLPNPWNFITECIPPWVVSTSPPDGAMAIPLDALIMVQFSEPMNMTSVTMSVNPDPGGWGPIQWTVAGTSLSWNHSNNYTTCTVITVTIHTGEDLAGLGLVPLPYSWSFLTVCPNPYMASTVPADGATDVELNAVVEIEFSDPMDTATVTWTIAPDPGGWSQNWFAGDTLLTLSHDPFGFDSTYTFEVTGGQDNDGFPLIPGLVPNPWSWTTKVKPLAPPTNLSAFLSGPSFRDVTVTWQLSDDDFPGGNVSYYDVYRGDAYDGNGAGYGLLGSVPSGVSQYVDQLAGQDGQCHFYFVCAARFGGESNCSEGQAGKFTRPLATGPNLVSVPLVQVDESVETVLQTVMYDKAWHYDTSSGWKWHMRSKGYGDLTDVNHTMGLWVNVTGASSLIVAGAVPAQTTIHLSAGWNLVSFPSFNSSYTVADLKAELPVERVEGFVASSPPHFLRVLQGSDVLLAGEGYWVKVSADATWVVFNG